MNTTLSGKYREGIKMMQLTEQQRHEMLVKYILENEEEEDFGYTINIETLNFHATITDNDLEEVKLDRLEMDRQGLAGTTGKARNGKPLKF